MSRAPFCKCLVDLSLAEDLTVEGSLTIPAGWRLGFAKRDAGQGGVDPQRPEIRVTTGTLAFDVNATSSTKIILRSDDPLGAAGDWFGIRTPESDILGPVTLPNENGAVEIRHARGAFAIEADLSGGSVTWPNFSNLAAKVTFVDNVSQISIDRDLEITTERTIPAGWTVGFAAGREEGSSASSADPGLIELIVKGDGKLTAEGTAANPIRFRSDSPTPGLDDWFGTRVGLTGVENTAYGFVWCATGACPKTTLKHVTISDALYGVAIDSLRAPTLDSLSFNNITSDRHIFLNGTDVMVTVEADWYGGGWDYWNLLPGTRVVAKNTCSKDLSYGNAERVDLVVLGKFTATGTASDSVYFVPETITSEGSPDAGDDWGGITLLNDQAVSISYGQIGHAKTPVFIYYPGAQATLYRSTVHRFAETGVWIRGSTGDLVSLNGCRVVRGDALHPSLADLGVFVDASDKVTILDSVVSLRGLDNGSGGAGVVVKFGKTFCETNPPSSRAVLVQGNVVVGPGLASGLAEAHTGIKLEDICGSAYRDIDVIENDVEEWKYAGIEVYHSSDAQVTCNRSEGNRRAVQVTASGTPTAVRFRENVLRALVQSEDLHAVGTNHVGATALGTDTSTRGDNRITALQTDTKLVRNTASDSLDATYNFWFKNANGDEMANDVRFDVQDSILARTVGPVRVLNFNETLPSWGCSTPDTTLSGGSQAIAPDGLAALDPAAAMTTAPHLALPTVRVLGKPYPNPSRGEVDVSLAIPTSDVGRYMLDVFDIGGRRVFERVWDVPTPGYYRVGWGGRDRDGARVATGVYFFRVRGPAFHQLRKVVLVR